MAVVEPAIKLVKLSDGEHKLDASFLEGHTWAEVTEIASKHFKVEVYTTLPTLSTATDAQFEEYKRTLALVEETGATGTYVEYIVVGDAKATATWERIGTTETDLSNYVKKDTTYTGAALSNGAHTHTVQINSINRDATKKLGAEITEIAVEEDGTDTFVKSYPGSTSKLVTTSITGVSGSTSASKAAAGTAFNAVKTVSITGETTSATGRVAYVSGVSAVSLGGQTAVPTNAIKSVTLSSENANATGRIAYVTASGAPSLGGTTTFNTDAIKSAQLTGTTTFAVQPSIDANGVLIFNTASVGISTTPASTGTVTVSAGTDTVKYLAASGTAADTSNVTVSGGSPTTKYMAVGTTTESVTPYTFSDVTVPKAASSATTVATGSLDANGGGAAVMTGLGTATTASALTGVKVTAQPTITITEKTTNSGPVNEHITVDTVSATTSSDGAHTHNIKVSS